jgi:hypothetical protein
MGWHFYINWKYIISSCSSGGVINCTPFWTITVGYCFSLLGADHIERIIIASNFSFKIYNDRKHDDNIYCGQSLRAKIKSGRRLSLKKKIISIHIGS